MKTRGSKQPGPQARAQLFEWAATALTKRERRFLLSIGRGKPDSGVLAFEDFDKWLAIQRQLHLIRQTSASSHKMALSRLQDLS